MLFRSHPLLAQAAAAEARGRCFRETPVTAVVEDMLIEGVVDFAFETEDGVHVIDFKTDNADGELLDQYRRQVAFYATAIARATGQPARATLMKV